MENITLSKKTICRLFEWNYNNFVQHLSGKNARQSTAKKYANKLGGDWKVWVVGSAVERQLVYTSYISKQLQAAA